MMIINSKKVKYKFVYYWSLLILVFLFFSINVQVLSQDEVITFDLDKSEFNEKKLSYLQPIQITGIAKKNNVDIDIIQLKVTKLFKKDQDKWKIKNFELLQLIAQIEGLQEKIDVLSTIKDTITAKPFAPRKSNIARNLADINYSGLGEISLRGSSEDSIKLLTEIDEELPKLNKEYVRITKEKVKLEAEIILLEEKMLKAEFFQDTWTRKPGETDFSFTLNSRLEMSEDYSFEFKLFSANKTSYPVSKLLNTLYDKVEKSLQTSSLYEDSQIKLDVEKVVNTINNELFSDVLFYDSLKNRFSDKGLKISEKIKNELTSHFKSYFKEKGNNVRYSDNIDGYLTYVNSLITENSLHRTITTAQSDTLRLLLNDQNKNHKDSLNTQLTNLGYSSVDIGEIIRYYDSLVVNRIRMADAFSIYKNDSTAIAKKFEFIKNAYIAQGNVTKNSSSQTAGETKIDGTRLGTTYGIGLVALENNFDVVEWFMFLGISFRFAPFDNRLEGKNAYKSFLSRFSVLVAISNTANMQYNGKQLQNTSLSFKPVIGINFEPMKHLNIGAGMISFIQEPVVTSRGETHLRPYVSLSFDFNLFNYLIQKK